jgi:hypothetical protein
VSDPQKRPVEHDFVLDAWSAGQAKDEERSGRIGLFTPKAELVRVAPLRRSSYNHDPDRQASS